MTAPLSKTASSRLPQTGWLREISLPEILLGCWESHFEGHLFLERGSHRVTLHVGAAALFLVEGTNDGLAVLTELKRLGALTADQLEQVQAHALQQQCTETVALLAMKCVPAIEILKALKNTSRQRALDCFGWPDGHYRLAGAEPQAGRSDSSRIEVLKLVQEGLSRHWSYEKLIERLWLHVDSFPAPASRFGGLRQTLNTDLDPANHVPAIDGNRPFTEVFQSLLRTRQGAAQLWILDELEALDYIPCPPHAASGPPASNPRIEIQVDEGTIAHRGTAPKPRTAESFPSHSTAQSIRIQIEKWAHSLDEVDHFTILGLTPKCSQGEVKKAYLAAAKTYHPDRLAALGLEDLRASASQVFARMGEAFEILSDPMARSDYEAMQRGEYSRADAQRAAQAETFYRKAEVLIKMGDFDTAINFLRP
ncbi:J domain-containing protein, partial [Myxococcota bacterium]|nr:J domain-containing protein [Myxococcota bacterium]